MIPKKSNSGICIMGNYEISIQDSFGKKELAYGDNGGVYAFAYGSDSKRGAGSPPRVNASRPPGQWESLHVWFRAPRYDAGKKTENGRVVRVEHNGVLVQENWELTTTTRASPPWEERAEAPLLLQGDHGPVAFRNVYIRPLR